MAQAHPTVFLVQFQDDYVDCIAHGTELARVLDFLRPAEVRNVHQTIDAFLQLDEQAEVREVPNGARMLRIHRVPGFDFCPWVRFQLLQAQRHLALFTVDVQDDALDFIADFHEVLGAAQVLRPAHFRDVQKAFDARCDFDESAVVREDCNASLHLRSLGEFFGQCVPWV